MRFGQIQAVGDALFAIDDRGSLWRHSNPSADFDDEHDEQAFIEGWKEVPHPDDQPVTPPEPPPTKAHRQRVRGSHRGK